MHEVHFLGYCDGDLDTASPTEAIGRIVAHIRRVKPQVVLTFAPDGAYGHPDHVAICQFTTAAVICAADSELATNFRITLCRIAFPNSTTWLGEQINAGCPTSVHSRDLYSWWMAWNGRRRPGLIGPSLPLLTPVHSRDSSVARHLLPSNSNVDLRETFADLPAEHHRSLMGFCRSSTVP